MSEPKRSETPEKKISARDEGVLEKPDMKRVNTSYDKLVEGKLIETADAVLEKRAESIHSTLTVEDVENTQNEVEELIQKATNGEKIDKKKLSPQVKTKLMNIDKFDLVVNAIIDESPSSQRGSGRKRPSLFKDGVLSAGLKKTQSSQHGLSKNDSLSHRQSSGRRSSRSRGSITYSRGMFDKDKSPPVLLPDPEPTPSAEYVSKKDSAKDDEEQKANSLTSSQKLNKNASESILPARESSEMTIDKTMPDNLNSQRNGSDSMIPSQELADVANSLEEIPIERVVQSQANLYEYEDEKPEVKNEFAETPKKSSPKKNKTVTQSSKNSGSSRERHTHSLRSLRSSANEQKGYALMKGKRDSLGNQKSSVPADRFVTYKVHQLDWFDVESRIKKICTNITVPLADNVQNFKQRLTKNELSIQINLEDTAKLNAAVFHKDKQHRNIFHIMQDTITKVRSEQKKHIEEVNSQMQQHQLRVKEMKFAIENETSRVDNFESYLDKNKALIEQIKDALEDNMTEISSKVKQVHGDITKMVQDIGTRQNNIDSTFEFVQEKLELCVQRNEMMDKRTKSTNQKMESLTILVNKLEIEKQEKSNFQEQKAEIQATFDEINKNLDLKENAIKIVENFVDKYVPIRIQQQIGETMQYIGTHSMKQKLENHEMEKFKKLNEDLLEDEETPELIDLCNKILADLAATVDHYKKVAKKKGMRYEIKKKPNLSKKGREESSSSIQMQSNRLNSEGQDSDTQLVTLAGGESRHLRENEYTPDDMQSKESLENHTATTQEGNNKPLPLTVDASKQSINIGSKSSLHAEVIAETVEPVDVSPGIGSDHHLSSQNLDVGEAYDSDYEENEQNIKDNKQKLLDWVVDADFTKDLSLANMANHKFRLDSEEVNSIHGSEGILKICKVLMYKIGLSYKRQEIFKSELTEEIAKIGQNNNNKFRADMDSLQSSIAQAHDELEDYTSKQQKFREHIHREMKVQKERSITTQILLEQWKSDLNQIALVQSCTSEFIQMQTTLDQQAFETRADQIARLSNKVNRLSACVKDGQFNVPSKPNKDLHKVTKKQETNEVMDTQKGSEVDLHIVQPSKQDSLMSQESTLPKGAKIVVEQIRDTEKIPMLKYRDIELKVIDFITMRSLIHQKIHQIMLASPLHKDFMPSKIFFDLVTFIHSANKSFEVDHHNLPQLPSHEQLTHDFTKIMHNLEAKQASCRSPQEHLSLNQSYDYTNQQAEHASAEQDVQQQYQPAQFQTLQQRKESNLSFNNSSSRKALLKPTYNISYKSPGTNQRHMSQSNIRPDYQSMPPVHDKQFNQTLDSNVSSSRIEDSYLRMLKHKNVDYTRKIHLGAGYEMQSKKKINQNRSSANSQVYMSMQPSAQQIFKISSGVNHAIQNRGMSMLVKTGDVEAIDRHTQQEFSQQLTEQMSESKGTKNATGTFNIGQDAGVQVTRNDDNLESSEVGTMYLRGGRNSSIGTTSNVRDISPSAGLGLSHYKNTSTPQQRQVLGLPGIVNSSMQSEAKIPTIPMQELPLIAKQVKGPSSIQQT